MTAAAPVTLARHVIAHARDEGVFPAAAVQVGDSEAVLWRESFGTLTFDTDSAKATDDTVFDLASLTKPIVTTSVILQLVANRSMTLHDLVAASLEEWRGADREGVTIQDLLEHAGGLSARLLDPPPEGRREFEHEICTMPLEYAPLTKSIYSDLGFILLGFVAEDRGAARLSHQFRHLWSQVATRGSGVLDFDVTTSLLAKTAPTEPMEQDRRKGRRLIGEVHDDYASALGGSAGHAGLFGDVAGVGRFAQVVLRGARGAQVNDAPFSAPLVARATRKSVVPGSSRALGWDTMLPTSSCGSELSPAAFGHVGFTGTSLWIDPILDRYFVLLTNRVCGGGTSEQMQGVRRSFHDAVAKL